MIQFFKSVIVAILTLEARAVLWRRKPRIVVITGSVGKTSTKDAIATALSISFRVRKSEKSFNSDIGVPLTILNLKNAWKSPALWFFNILRGFLEIIRPGEYPEWLVLEVGADKPGDLKKIFSWLSADVVAVTRFPDVPVHVEFYESRETLIEEESIPAFHIKDNGLLVLNRDDEKVWALRNATRARVISYGLTPVSDVSGSAISVAYEGKGFVPSGMNFRVDHSGSSIPVFVKGALGVQHIYPVLGAYAVGLEQGINLVRLSDAFKSHLTPPGRMRILPGLRSTVLIDDSYNSSPVALAEALGALGMITHAKRKIAVLGDMLELGSFSKEEHKKAGNLAVQAVEMLITVGIRARGIAEGALSNGMDEKNILQFDESYEAGKFLEKMIQEGDIILVKGSQSIRTERIVEEVMLHPEDREKLLVRQEEEWQRR